MNLNPAALALLLATSAGLMGAPARPRPNILFILSDDHSYPFLGCYGDPNVRTPAIDRLAAEGMKFHRFFAVSPQCVPARAGFLTGRSAVAARMTRFSAPLPRDEPTFLEQLREQAGYHTGICGRSYHLDGSGAHFQGTIGRFLDEQGLRTFAQRVDYLRVGTDTEAIGQMREFLDQRPQDKPFCLWLNFSDPHHPWTAPASDRPDPAALKLPAYLPDLPAVRGQLADHLAEINRLDHSMQATLDLLAERGLAANTLVIFIGDNGSALPHGKGSLYDPGVNVPLVMRWPGVIAAGGDSRALLSGEDLAPTILAAAGLPAGPKMSGRSFLPLLAGGTCQPREHVFFERGPHATASVTVDGRSNDFDLSRSVRGERYKLIYNCTPWVPYAPVDLAAEAGWGEITAARNRDRLTAGQRGTYLTTPRPVYELYDLEADPAELENRSGQPAWRAIEAKLRVALAEKMILDSDYLPLPALLEGAAPSPVSGPAGTKPP